MNVIQISEIISQISVKKEPQYQEFVREPSMNVGIYYLPQSRNDEQKPHSEDEVYYIIAGEAEIWIEGMCRPVESGSTIFVSSGASHRFSEFKLRSNRIGSICASRRIT